MYMCKYPSKYRFYVYYIKVYMRKFNLTEEAFGQNILKSMFFLLNNIHTYICIYMYIYTYIIYNNNVLMT